jgi:hypothetical protein
MSLPPIEPNDVDDAGNELGTQLDRVAELLETLASMAETPVGMSRVSDPFEASEVDFETGNWLLRILSVQGWINLDADLSSATAEGNPGQTLQELFESIAGKDSGAYYEVDNGVPRLNLSGAEVLAGRLDQAVFLAQQFQELREANSARQATDIWRELWEEEEGIIEPQLDPIKATTTVWGIQQFADLAARGKLNLSPSYQRGDVWSTDHCQKLITSILRGIPLPSVILLKQKSKGGSGHYHEVVDGKQRLTSILRFIGKHPLALKRVEAAALEHPELKLMKVFEEDYRKFRRLWLKHFSESLTARKEAEYYFPFKLPAPGIDKQTAMNSVLGKYYCDIRAEQLPGMMDDTVRDIFEWPSSHYRLPTIEYSEATPAQIHEVFHLYNRQGKHLNAEEIRNAIFHEVELMTLLMVASGDSGQVDDLVPYAAAPDKQRLSEISAMVTEYHAGTARYRRTKLISWVVSILMHPALQDDGQLAVRSTAKHIDDLLGAIRNLAGEKDDHWLQDRKNLKRLVELLHRTLEAHSASAAWAPVFKDDGTGAKWQELQLVASLVGTFLVAATFEEPIETLEKYHEQLLSFTAAHRRPEKSQNRTQWGYIGAVALGIYQTVGGDFEALDQALVKDCGLSCVPTLRAAATHYKPRS